MFESAKLFNQSINSWDVNNVSKFDNIFDNCPISEENKPVFRILI
jgi:hypothetical protein